MRLYRHGDSGEPIRDIQSRLTALGLSPISDPPGEFGADTGQAVIKFQRSRGLGEDGIVGPDGRAQIWVEVDTDITVHVWDYRKRRQVFAVDGSTLANGLDDALRVAKTWCGTP